MKTRQKVVVAALLAAACAVPLGLAQAPDVAPTVIRVSLPQEGRNTIFFDVAGGLENRLVFSSLRTTARVGAISLFDPSGRQVWRKTAEELKITPRDIAANPTLGDAIVFPEVRDAASGRWQLVIERAAADDSRATLQLGYQLLDRFDLNVTTTTTRVSAGQPVLVFVRPSDYGAPMSGLTGMEIVALDSSGSRSASAMAVERPPSSTGIAITNELGGYGATFTFARPGVYRLRAARAFQGRSAVVDKTAVLSVTVVEQAGEIELVGVRFKKTATQCARRAIFDFAVNVAAAGTYACSLTFGASTSARTASASAVLAKGKGRVSVAVASETLIAASPSLQNIDRVALTRFAETGVTVVAERLNVALNPPIRGDVLCK